MVMCIVMFLGCAFLNAARCVVWGLGCACLNAARYARHVVCQFCNVPAYGPQTPALPCLKADVGSGIDTAAFFSAVFFFYRFRGPA